MKTQDVSTTTTPTRLLRKPTVIDRVALSDTTIWRRVKDGTFPAPVKISVGAIAWRESDIEAWIASREESGR